MEILNQLISKTPTVFCCPCIPITTLSGLRCLMQNEDMKLNDSWALWARGHQCSNFHNNWKCPNLGKYQEYTSFAARQTGSVHLVSPMAPAMARTGKAQIDPRPKGKVGDYCLLFPETGQESQLKREIVLPYWHEGLKRFYQKKPIFKPIFFWNWQEKWKYTIYNKRVLCSQIQWSHFTEEWITKDELKRLCPPISGM